jgi:hypothetical protein
MCPRPNPPPCEVIWKATRGRSVCRNWRARNYSVFFTVACGSAVGHRRSSPLSPVSFSRTIWRVFGLGCRWTESSPRQARSCISRCRPTCFCARRIVCTWSRRDTTGFRRFTPVIGIRPWRLRLWACTHVSNNPRIQPRPRTSPPLGKRRSFPIKPGISPRRHGVTKGSQRSIRRSSSL